LHNDFGRPTAIFYTAFNLFNTVVDSRHTLRQWVRDEMKPSIEAATKLAQLLEVSLDWLVGSTDAELDTATINRIQDINKLSQKDKELVFEFLDSFISNRKIKSVMG
jgi:transcriptional regulator with XRE-family HTH domain